jgi:hypothetical protein
MFVKPHKAPNIKQVPWTDITSLTKRLSTAPVQTWSKRCKIDEAGFTLMTVLKTTKKGKTLDQVYTTLA